MKHVIVLFSLLATVAVAESTEQSANAVMLDKQQSFSVVPVIPYSLDETSQVVIFKPLESDDTAMLPKNCIISAEAVTVDGQININASHMLCVSTQGKALDSAIKANISLLDAASLECHGSCDISADYQWKMVLRDSVELSVQWEH